MAARPQAIATIALSGEAALSGAARAAARRAARPQRVGWAAFAGMASFAAWQWTSLLANRPGVRIAAVVAIATLGGSALARSARWQAGRLGGVDRALGVRLAGAGLLLRIAIVLLTAAAALLAIGVPARLLAPAHWGALSAGISQGLAGMGGFEWPYSGPDPWVRLTLLLAIPAVVVPAAALAHWPTRRRSELPRSLGLAALVALYAVGAIEHPPAGWQLRGLLLLALVAIWIWPDRLRRRSGGVAMAWLLACGGLAVVAAAALHTARPWVDVRGWDLFGELNLGTQFTWDELYGPITWPRSTTPMLKISSSSPLQLWRAATLDRFDGLRFIQSSASLPGGADDLSASLNYRWLHWSTVSVSGLRSDLVVAPGTIVRLTGSSAVTAQSDGATRVVGGSLQPGDAYTALSYVPDPTLSQLLNAPRSFPAAYLPYTAFDLPAPDQSGLAPVAISSHARATLTTARTVESPAPGFSPADLPALEQRVLASPYGPMYRLAQRLAAGEPTTYEIARSIEGYLDAHYTYDEHPPQRRYPLEAFLFRDRRGYCQQFSGAMALMLRMDGIPARVVTGFLAGAYDRTSRSYTVRAVDAHAWVEAYISGIGWVSFDPTPPRVQPRGSSRRATAAQTPARTPSAPNGVTPSGARGQRDPVVAHASRHRAASTAAHARSAGKVPLAAILGPAAALVALAIAAWGSGLWRLRRELAGDAEPAVAQLRRALVRLGYGPSGALTLSALERRLRARGELAASRYVARLRAQRFGAGGQAQPTAADRAQLRRALTRGAGPLTRVLGLVALPPRVG